MSNENENCEYGISSFWLGPLKNWRFTNEASSDMITVTKIIHSIEKMVGSLSTEKISVRLASELKAVSNWSERKIVLPSHFLWSQETFYNFSHIVDIWTAIALHEAGHIVLSEKLAESSLNETHEFIICHIVEDFWVESWIGQRFPGYEPYLVACNQHLYGSTQHLGEDVISQKINDFVYLLKCNNYQTQFPQSQSALQILKEQWLDANGKNEVRGWDRISLGLRIFSILFPEGLTTEIVRGTKELHFDQPDIEPAAPSSQISDSPLEVPSPYLLSGQIRKDQMIQFHQQVKEGKKLSWASEQMMESWLANEEKFLEQAKTNTDTTTIKRPDIDQEGYEMYRNSYMRIKPYILKLKRKFQTANTPRMYDYSHLQQGILDEEALHRAPFSVNLFKIEEEKYDVIDKWDITVLVDQSRSTEKRYDERNAQSLKQYEVAMDIAVLFACAFKQIKPIDVSVYAFSTAKHLSLLEIEELYTSHSQKIERIGMIRPKGATPEFLALKELTLKMIENGRGASRKLIVILSDGQPDDYVFGGGNEHKQKIKEWINKWGKRGFTFAHIAIAENIETESLYPFSISFDRDYATLIERLYRWITKTISKGQ